MYKIVQNIDAICAYNFGKEMAATVTGLTIVEESVGLPLLSR